MIYAADCFLLDVLVTSTWDCWEDNCQSIAVTGVVTLPATEDGLGGGGRFVARVVHRRLCSQ